MNPNADKLRLDTGARPQDTSYASWQVRNRLVGGQLHAVLGIVFRNPHVSVVLRISCWNKLGLSGNTGFSSTI